MSKSISAAAPRASVDGVLSADAILAARATGSAGARARAPIVYKTDDLSYDLGLLTAFDTHPLDPAETLEELESVLHRTATEDAQLLVRAIWGLETTVGEAGPVALLPARTTRLPRMRPVPKPKPLTRWQKFAAEKGIKKQKRGRLVWDESLKEWIPRTGYGRKAAEELDWARPVRAGEDPRADPWEGDKVEKKRRVVENQLNHVKNLERSSGAAVGGPPPMAVRVAGSRAIGTSGHALVAPPVREGAAPADRAHKSKKRSSSGVSLSAQPHTTGSGEALLVPTGIARLPDAVEGGGRKRVREDKTAKVERLRAAQVSTASLGKFDSKRPGEPDRPKDPKKQKRKPVEMPAAAERTSQEAILRRILGGEGDKRGGAAAAATRDMDKTSLAGKKRRR